MVAADRARLRTRLIPLAFAALALLVIAQGLYILRPGWFRANGISRSPAAGTPPTPAAEPVQAGSAGGSQAPAAVAGSAPTAPAYGRLNVRSEPAGATVSIDGRPYGVTPLALSDVRPGDLRVVLRLGGREIKQTVRVEAGVTASLIVPMPGAAAAAPTAGGAATTASGWVAIASAAELDIMQGDVLVGSTRSPQVMMPAGQHTLRLVNASLNYETTQQIRVEPGKVARINVTLPEGTLHLNARPWAEVLLDGKPIGETPIGNFPVRIGTHQIVFRHPDLGEKSVSTVVKAGAPSRVTVDLRN
jgi:hypothetical protein